MRILLRITAVAIAIASLVDPTIARRVDAPLSVQFRLPPASHPDFTRADALYREMAGSVEQVASIDGANAPHAIVAIGDAEINEAAGARVFAMLLPPRRPGTSIEEIAVPRRTVPGQAAPITASVNGAGLAGRTSTFSLELRGSVVATAEHTWTADDERFDVRFSIVPPGAGVHRVRVKVNTNGVSEVPVADAVVVAREAPLKVLVFEARPSWPVTFVRRSLEEDSLFAVASAARSSRPVVTTSGGAAASLANLEVDRYDTLIAGSLEDLRAPDFEALDRFVSDRGGTLVLLPDRQVSEAVRRQFNLPVLEEALLEKPTDVKGGAALMRASELLLFGTPLQAVKSLGSVQHGKADRPVVATIDRGAGRIVFSGALDAWRYRAATSDGFDMFWRGLVADAALAAPSKLDVTVEPALARPGDTVKVTVAVRGTETEPHGGAVRVAPVAASLLAADGRQEPIRLWPSPRAGALEAHLTAPTAGRYTISASIAGTSTDTPLLTGDDVVHPASRASGAVSYAARATGGAELNDPRDLLRALSDIETGTEERSTRPMRSPWWIVPFSLLLCAEWALRRRSGLK